MAGKKKGETQESNATKATKLIEEFLKKVSQGVSMLHRGADNTALSGSLKDESHDEARPFSNISRGRNSRKSLHSH